MKIAIVGYRNFNDYRKFEKEVNNIIVTNKLNVTEIISGGATGADHLAQIYALSYEIPLTVYKAEWEKYGKFAGPQRNSLIVKDADVIIAFLSQESKGTVNTINLAKKANKKVFVVNI